MTARKLFYLFLLGLGTYFWWKFTKFIKQKIEEEEE